MWRTALTVLLLAASAAAADEETQALVARTGISDVRPEGAGVYRRYKDGLPRLVVVSRYVRFGEGEILLLRFPDRAGAKGTIVDRYDPEAGAMDVTFLRLVDPRDVVVEVAQNHGVGGRIFRIRGEKLVEIAEDDADASNTPDLDGDGIPEIVWSGDAHRQQCGVRQILWGVLHWDGDYYDSDHRAYTVIHHVTVGARDPFVFGTGESSGIPTSSHYVVRIARQRGVENAYVLLDGRRVAPDKPFELADGCHTFDIRATGARGATAWALLEAVDR